MDYRQRARDLTIKLSDYVRDGFMDSVRMVIEKRLEVIIKDARDEALEEAAKVVASYIGQENIVKDIRFLKSNK